MTEVAAVPPRAEIDPPRWGVPDAVIGWFVVQVIGQLAAAVVLVASGHAGDDFDDLPLEIVALVQVGLAFGFFIVPFVVTRVKGNGLVADLGFRIRWSDTWRGGVLGALLQVPVLPLIYWPILRLADKTASDLEGPARSLGDRADGVTGALLLILIVGVVAPIFEELFYRGLLQRSLLKHGLPPWVAVGTTALVFGASHLQLLQLPALVLAGAVFGWLAHHYGRLGPAIAAHVAFNMVTVIALLAG